MKIFDELKNEIDNLTTRIVIKICESPNFENKIKKIKKDSLLIEIIHVLVKEEKYEHAAIVRDEMKHRGLDLSVIPKWAEYEEMINRVNK